MTKIRLAFDEIVSGAKVSAGSYVTATTQNADELAALVLMNRATEIADLTLAPGSDLGPAILDQIGRQGRLGITISNSVVPAGVASGAPLARITSSAIGAITLAAPSGVAAVVGNTIVATGTPIADGIAYPITVTVGGRSASFTLLGRTSSSSAPTPPQPSLPAAANLVMDFQASSITGLADGAQITDGVWKDGKSASVGANAFGTKPTYRATAFGGQPAVRFTGNEGLDIGRPQALIDALNSGNATIVIVMKPNGTAANSYCGPFGNDYQTAQLCDGTGIGRQQGPGRLYGGLPGGLIVYIETADTTNIPGAGVGYGRAFINGTGLSTAMGLKTGVGSINYAIGCAQVNSDGIYGSSRFNGDVMVAQAFNKTFSYAEVIQTTKYWLNRHSQPLPWAGKSRFVLFSGNSITDWVGSDSAGNTMPQFAAAAMGLTWGQYGQIGRASATIAGVRTIVERELPGLSAALGIPVLHITNEWANSDSYPSAANAWDSSLVSFKSIDPSGKTVLWTSTNKANPGQTADAATESQRQSFNSYFYDASKPGNIAAGRTNLDLVIGVHTDAAIGVAGAASGPNKGTYFYDYVHLQGNGNPQSGAKQLGSVIASAVSAANL